MSAIISSKIVKNLHAAIDDLAASNPEAAGAIYTILNGLTKVDSSVTVKSARVAKKSSTALIDDEDDLDAIDEKPTRTPKGRRPVKAEAKPVKAVRGGKKVVDEDEDDLDDLDGDEDEEDEAGEVPELSSLDEGDIKDFLEAYPTDVLHSTVEGLAFREVSVVVKELGLVPSEITDGMTTRSEKVAAMAGAASAAMAAIDAIAKFDLDDIVAAYDDLAEDAYEVPAKGRANAKKLAAARAYFDLVIS